MHDPIHVKSNEAEKGGDGFSGMSFVQRAVNFLLEHTVFHDVLKGFILPAQIFGPPEYLGFVLPMLKYTSTTVQKS